MARLEANPAVTAVALQVHPGPRIGAKTIRRWILRRTDRFHDALRTANGLFAKQLSGCVPTMRGLRSRVGQDRVLNLLYTWCAEQELAMRPPVGLSLTDRVAPKEVHFSLQSPTIDGPDPPTNSSRDFIQQERKNVEESAPPTPKQCGNPVTDDLEFQWVRPARSSRCDPSAVRRAARIRRRRRR